MIVVSDTSPLNYLVLIREERVLPLLFSRVVVPRSVLAEMSHAATPETVRAWVASLPSWVELRSPAVPPARLGDLGPGELDAIAIAEDLRADALLIDERDGRRVARERGIATYGTVAVLEAAAARGVCSFSRMRSSASERPTSVSTRASCRTRLHAMPSVGATRTRRRASRPGQLLSFRTGAGCRSRQVPVARPALLRTAYGIDGMQLVRCANLSPDPMHTS